MARNRYKPTGKRKRIGAVGALLRLTAGIVVVVVGGFMFLTRTDSGRATLVNMIENVASSSDLKLSIGRLEGAVPFDMTVRNVTIADRDGTWLDIDQARVVWRPLALLSGVLDIPLIEANRIGVARAPVSSVADESQTASTSFPQLPFGITLEELKVAEVALGDALFGQTARLALKGSAQLVDYRQGLNVDLSMGRIDGQAGQITGHFGYVPQNDVLTLDVLAKEPAGGIVSHLAGIKDLPSLSFSAKGSGPLDSWKGKLALDLAEKAGASGTIAVKRIESARILEANINADIAALMPDTLAPLVKGQSDVAIKARFNDDGLIEVTQALVTSAAAQIEAHGEFEPQTQAISATARVNLGAPQTFAKLSPTLVSWSTAGLDINLDGTLSALNVKTKALVTDLASEGYQAKDVSLNLTANSNGPVSEEATRFDVALDSNVSGLIAPDEKLTQVLGDTVSLNARGTVDRSLVARIDQAHVVLNPLSLRFSGLVDPEEVIGNIILEKADLSALRTFAGREMAGQVKLNADIDVAFNLSRLGVTLNGAVEGLRTGVPQADGLMGGKVTVAGGVNRAHDGSFGFKALKLVGAHVSLIANGSATQSAADVQAKLQLSDLSKINSELQGSGDATVTLTGSLKNLVAKAAVSIPKARAMGRPIESLKLNVDAQDLMGATNGMLTLAGLVDGKPARGSGRFARGLDGSSRLDNLDIVLGSVAVRGGVAFDANQLATGRLNVTAGNLADLQPLLLTKLEGRIDLQADLSQTQEGQNARIVGSIDQFTGFDASLRRANIDATGRDLFRRPMLDAHVEIEEALANSISVTRATITAKGIGQTNDMRMTGVVQGSDMTAAAKVTLGDTTSIIIDQARLSRGNQRIEVSPNARIELNGGKVRVSDLEVRSGAGRLQIAGEAGDRLNINAKVQNFPLAIAELFAPGVGLVGTVSGESTLIGSAARPDGRYQLNVAGLSVPAIVNAGLRSFTVTASGVLGQGRITTDATVRGQNNVTLRIQGSAPLGEGNLDLAITGPIDLGIANVTLSASGQTLTGVANVDLRLRGTAAAPAVGGSVRVVNGRFQDPVQGLFFDNIQAVVTGNERELTITSLSARTRNGGMVTGAGQVAVDPAAGFPGNITIRAQRAQLVSSEMVNMVSNLDLAISGPLAQSPTLSGAINVENLQITIPNRFPLSLTPIEVQHIHPPPRVRARIEREAKAAAQASAAKPFVMALDLTISSPTRVFVRGQGINAELGGKLKVHGNSNNPVVDGSFQMRRGTLSIVGRTLTFSRGEVSFSGSNLDPTLDFMAEAPAGDITAQIGVTGFASNPQITISSSPELPRDEVFARLIFGQPVTNLSTGQTIRLAQTIAQLTGGSDALGNLGRSLGVDSIEIGSDDAGNVNVGISKRINDNIYLGVSSSGLTVNLDITDHIKLQGEAGVDGSSSVGVGMEWDY